MTAVKPNSYRYGPDETGHFGIFGGRFIPETLMPLVLDLEQAYRDIKGDQSFQSELARFLEHYVGRPSPLYFAERLTEYCGGAKIYLKREDLNHTGAHKINNCMGQILLARRMGKRQIIAKTGAGQHGVATATVSARFGLHCVVYMGAVDIARQKPNVFRMRLLGAEVRAVTSGSRTLKDAMNEAIRDWVTNVADTYYLIGTVAGHTPTPSWCATFNRSSATKRAIRCWRAKGAFPTAWWLASAVDRMPWDSFIRFSTMKALRCTRSRPQAMELSPGVTPHRSAQGRLACCTAASPISVKIVRGRSPTRIRFLRDWTTPASARNILGFTTRDASNTCMQRIRKHLPCFSCAASWKALYRRSVRTCACPRGKAGTDSSRGSFDGRELERAGRQGRVYRRRSSRTKVVTERIADCFARLKAEDRAGLAAFVTAGDPNPNVSLSILQGLPEAGADLIELGMPFSDPIADGPEIQASSRRALNTGATMDGTFQLVRGFRKSNLSTPIVLMGYFNPIYVYGVDRFLNEAL